jgi:hypothetical protein
MGFTRALNEQDYVFFALMLVPLLVWVVWVAYTWRAHNGEAKRARSGESSDLT